VELLGISSVAGNQTCDITTENAVQVLAAAGLGSVGAAAQVQLHLRNSVPCRLPGDMQLYRLANVLCGGNCRGVPGAGKAAHAAAGEDAPAMHIDPT